VETTIRQTVGGLLLSPLGFNYVHVLQAESTPTDRADESARATNRQGSHGQRLGIKMRLVGLDHARVERFCDQAACFHSKRTATRSPEPVGPAPGQPGRFPGRWGGPATSGRLGGTPFQRRINNRCGGRMTRPRGNHSRFRRAGLATRQARCCTPRHSSPAKVLPG